MITEIVEKPVVFEPVVIQLTFESKQDLIEYREELRQASGPSFELYQTLGELIDKY